MDFLKQHYEKILLSVILLGLAVAAAWLLMAIEEAKRNLVTTVSIEPRPAKPLDLQTNELALQAVQNPPGLKITDGTDLFNPMTWRQRPDGSIMRIASASEAEALKILKIEPLDFILSFDRKADGDAYYLGVVREANHRLPAPKLQRYAKLNVTNDVFVIRQVKGPAEDPAELVVELTDSRLYPNAKNVISIAKDKPYQHVEGYSVDLKNDVDGKIFRDQRVGTNVVLSSDSYKIIAINQNEVRVQANSNQKPTTIRRNGGSQ